VLWIAARVDEDTKENQDERVCAVTAGAVLSLKETKGSALEDVFRADAEREGLVGAGIR
jgi:hypothetical protein